MSAFKAVILAGGSGERFWPLSTPERPKQFLRIFGGESLLRQSVTRLSGLVAPEDIYVVTSAALRNATRKELPELPAKNIVGEPMRRDTGAAIALGVGLAAKSEDDILAFFSSDQLVGNPRRFRQAVRKARARAAKGRTIVTLGITPSHPATCFGYVDPKRGTFVEKPDAARARRYLARGYLWNAGMFIAKAGTFRTAFSRHAPDLSPLANGPVPRTAALKARYAALPKISFDYAVMEKYGDVAVVAGDFGWDDVGSYGAFDRYFPHDAKGNVREGPCTVVDSEGNICVARAARISLLGVRNLVVVTTPDAVLVVDKGRVTELKKLFQR